MSLVSVVKAMVRTNVVMSELDIQESRLARNEAHVAKLRNEGVTEEDLYELRRWEVEVADAERQVAAWKAELAVSRSQFFSVEEVDQLKVDGALTALLNELERSDASKIPFMLQKNGADFISVAKWAIKDRYFWNGLCPW